MKSLTTKSYTLKHDHKFRGVRLLKGDKVMAYPHEIESIKRTENLEEDQRGNVKTEGEIDFLSQEDFRKKKGDK